MTFLSSRKSIFAVLLLSTALNGFGLTWGLPSVLGWAADELTPVRVLTGMRQGFAHGWHDPYPPFHFYLLAAAYAPVLAVDSQPLADIVSSETGWRRRAGDSTYMALFVVGRLVSLLMALGTILAVYRAGRLTFGRGAGTLAALIIALTLPFIYYAKIANVDLPLTFWFCLAFVAYLRILRGHRLHDYLFYAVTAVLAVCAKDQAYGLFVLPSLHIFLSLRRHAQRSLAASLVDRRIVLAGILGAAAFLVAEGIVFNPSGFVAHLKVATGPMNRNLQMYERSPEGYVAMLALTSRLLLFSLGVPAAIACAAGAFLAWRRDQRHALVAILLPCVSYGIFFMGAVLVGYDRYLMPVCACLSLLGGYFLAGDGAPAWARWALGAAVIVFGLTRGLAVDLSMVGDSRYAAEAWMAGNIPRRAPIAVIGPLTHLPRVYGYDWTQRNSLTGVESLRPEYVILTSDYAREASGEDSLVDRTARELGYGVAFRGRTALPGPLDLGPLILGLEGYTNLHKINPEVAVLKRPEG